MRAVRIIGGGVAVEDVPEPAGDGVLLEVVASSICGTDVGMVAMGATGFTLGHEFAGTVDGVAYAVEPTVYCGRCEECLAGRTQRCSGEHGNLGIFLDGGLADRVVVSPEALVPLPRGLDPADACLVEPTAVAWHGMRLAALQPGERVAVVGGGSIGLLAAAVTRSLGHDVDLDARYPHQLEAGERLGAGRPSGLYDVVVDAAGSESSVERCAELARPGGRVVLLGVYYDRVPVPGVVSLVKELSYISAMAYGREGGDREVERAAQLLASDPQIAATLVTHRFALDDAAEAFRVAADRRSGARKVVLLP